MMVDENGIEQEVFYNEPMPADFKRSEQVVVNWFIPKRDFRCG